MSKWLVAPWGVILLVLLAIVSILLAAGSSLAWHRADEVRSIYLGQVTGAQRIVDSLAAAKCVPVNNGDIIRVYPAPRPDTLKRARR